MKNLSYIFIVIIISCTGCKKSDETYNVIHLNGKIYDDEITAYISDIFILDSMLLTYSYRDKNIFNLYDLNDKRITRLGRYGSKGRSAKEFISPIVTSLTGDTITVYDYSNLSITDIVIDRDSMSFREIDRKYHKHTVIDNFNYFDFPITKMSGVGYIGLSLQSINKILENSGTKSHRSGVECATRFRWQ